MGEEIEIAVRGGEVAGDQNLGAVWKICRAGLNACKK